MTNTSSSYHTSLVNTLAFDPRDWSINRRDAWLWGIICGWDSDDPNEDPMSEVAARHGWNDETVAQLRLLHEQFEKDFSNEN